MPKDVPTEQENRPIYQVAWDRLRAARQRAHNSLSHNTINTPGASGSSSQISSTVSGEVALRSSGTTDPGNQELAVVPSNATRETPYAPNVTEPPMVPGDHGYETVSLLREKRRRSASPPLLPSSDQPDSHHFRPAAPTPRPLTKRVKVDLPDIPLQSSPSSSPHVPRGHFGSTARRRFERAARAPVSAEELLNQLIRSRAQELAATSASPTVSASDSAHLLNTPAQKTMLSDGTMVEPSLSTIPSPTLEQGRERELSNTDPRGLPTHDEKESGSSGSNLQGVDQTYGAENKAIEGESLPNMSGGMILLESSGLPNNQTPSGRLSSGLSQIFVGAEERNEGSSRSAATMSHSVPRQSSSSCQQNLSLTRASQTPIATECEPVFDPEISDRSSAKPSLSATPSTLVVIHCSQPTISSREATTSVVVVDDAPPSLSITYGETTSVNSPTTPTSHSSPRHPHGTPQSALVGHSSQQIDHIRELNTSAAGGQAPSLNIPTDATINIDPPGKRASHLTPTQAPVPFQVDTALDGVRMNSPATPISHSPPRHLLNTPQLAVVTSSSQKVDPGRELNTLAAGGQAPSLHTSNDATMNPDYLDLSPAATPVSESPVRFMDSTLDGVCMNPSAPPISHSPPSHLLNTPQLAVVTSYSQKVDPGRESNMLAAGGQAPLLRTSIDATMDPDYLAKPASQSTVPFLDTTLDGVRMNPPAPPVSHSPPSHLLNTPQPATASHLGPTQLDGIGMNSLVTPIFHAPQRHAHSTPSSALAPHSSQQINPPHGSNTTSASMTAPTYVNSSATLVSASLQTEPIFDVPHEGDALSFVEDNRHPPAPSPLPLELVDQSSLSPFTPRGPVRPRLPIPSFVPFTTGCYIPPRLSFFPLAPAAIPLQATQPNLQSSPEGSSPRSQRSVRFASPTASSSQNLQATQTDPKSSLEASPLPPSVRVDSSPTYSSQTHLGHRTPRQVSSDAKRERRKSNTVKAMQRLQNHSGQLDVGTPVSNISDGHSDSVTEADPDVNMSDACNEDGDGGEDGDGDGDGSEDGDRSEESEDGGDGPISNAEGQHEPSNLELTYEYLLANPDDPCNNAGLVAIMEAVVDLQADVQTVLQRGPPQQATSRTDDIDDMRRYPRRKTPKTQFGVTHTAKRELNLKDEVHAVAKELLKLSTEALRVPSVQQLRQFEKGDRDIPGPSAQHFCLDLASRGLNSKWNQRATTIFFAEYSSQKAYRYADEDAVRSAFQTYLRALKKRYRRQIVEATNDQAIKVAERDNAKRNSRYNRRTYKRHRRCNSLKSYAHHPGVPQIIEKLEGMPIDSMSGDETEHDGDDNEPYLIKTKSNWRSKQGDDLVEICDALDMSMRFQSDGRPVTGRFPDPRTPSARPDTRSAPKGLPGNLYLSEYLNDRTDEERRKLRIQPTFEFIFPVELLRIAERYRGVKTRSDKPLPRDHPRLALYTEPGTSLIDPIA